jgi:putative transcriptional regulator
MRLKAQTDQAIAKEIGARIQALRLKRNISVEDVAINVGISRQTVYLLLKHGKGTLPNLIAVLRAIDELERLSSLVADVLPSPIQIVRMEGKKRKRASGHRISSDGSVVATSSRKKTSDW